MTTMSERYTTPSLVLLMAKSALRNLRTSKLEYDEAVDAWYRSGPGRSPKWHTFVEGDEVWTENVGGKGYRFPECIHGKSYWTDYDNICGGCEDGSTLYEQALGTAWGLYREYLTRQEVYRVAVKAKAPEEVTRPIGDWVWEHVSYLFDNLAPIKRDLP